MEHSHSGENAYIILAENTSCPLRDPSLDDDDNLVNMNGITYISSSYIFPYDSFVNVIRFCGVLVGAFIGYVANMNTGELRYYDGTQGVGINADESIFWPAAKMSLGKVHKFSYDVKKGIQSDKELGQMYVNHHDPAGIFDYTISLDKMMIDTRKLLSSDIDSPVRNQFGYYGTGVLELDEFVSILESKYFLTILHLFDFNNDPSNIARNIIMPCTMFENIRANVANKSVITISATGKPTYGRTIPTDNVDQYVHSFTHQECIPTTLTVVDTTDVDVEVGDVGGANEFFNGEEILTVGAMSLYGIGIWINNIVDTPTDIILRLYNAPNGALIASSNQISYSDIVTGIETIFNFSLIPLAAATNFFIGIETVGDNPNGAVYAIQNQSAGGVGNQYERNGAGWPPPGVYVLQNLWDIRMKLYGCEA